jgi:transcriptional regulator with XRE-family HTH domain
MSGMAKRNPPTVRMRRLGAQLRRLREERGLTLDAAAELVNLSKSALHRMESAQVIVRPHEVHYLLIRYEITDEELHASLMGLAAAGRSRDWIRRHGSLTTDPVVADYIQLEQDSSAIRICQPIAIPGILQTPGYARAVMDSASFRMARKEVLSRPDPIRLDAVVGEAALRQRMGGADVMRGQLRHLMEASTPANVTVRAVPFAAASNPGLDGPFTLLDVETGNFTMVVIDGLARSVYLEDDAAVDRYNVVFEKLCATALSEAESRTLITQVLDELEGTR